MNKKIILGITGAVVFASTAVLVKTGSLLSKGFASKAEGTTATVILDGANNVLDDSYVYDTYADVPNFGVEQDATSSTGGYIRNYWTMSNDYFQTINFGGEYGVMTFSRNNGVGWRPCLDIYANDILSVELHFNREAHIVLKKDNTGQISRNDPAQKDYVLDYSSSPCTSVTIFFSITIDDWSGFDEEITLESIKVTYDVDACLAAH